MWDKIEKEELLDSILLKVKNGVPVEGEIELLSLCIKHQFSSGKDVTKEDKHWFVKLSCDILLLMKPSIERLDAELKRQCDMILNGILKLILREVNDVFNITFKEVTKSLSILFLESQTETLDDSIISKIKDCVNTLKLLCDSVKTQANICYYQINEQFVSLSCKLMLMEWFTEKDFVVLNQILSLFLDFGKEVHKETFVVSMQALYQRKYFSLLLLLITIHLDQLSSSNLIQEAFLWNYLQDGLVSLDPLPRKRALFVIKYVLDVISKQESFKTKPFDECSVVSWEASKSDHLWKIWKSVALILETLEEKQVHVINPVLPIVNEIVLASATGILHHSWLLVILEKAMTHESKLIQTWAVKYSLSLVDKFPLLAQVGHGFIFDKLFESLKNIFLYSTEEDNEIGAPPKLLSLLRTFFFSCFASLDESQSAVFCSKILEKLYDSTFNQIALIYITMALSKQKLEYHLSLSHMHQFQNFLMNKIPIYGNQFQTVIFQNISNFFANNIGTSKPELHACLSLVSIAYRSGVIVFNSKSWSVWCTYFQNLNRNERNEILKERLAHYMDESTQFTMVDTVCSEIVIIIQLTVTSDFPSDNRMLKDITTLIQKIPTNPYLSPEKVLKTLKYVEMQLNKHMFSVKVDQAQNHLLELADTIIQCVQQRFFTAEFNNEVHQEITMTCIKTMEGFAYFVNKSAKLSSSLTKFTGENIKNMLSFHSDVFDMVMLVNLHMLSKMIKTISSIHPVEDLKEKLIEFVINFDRKMLASRSKDSQFNCDMFISSAWLCLDQIFEIEADFTTEQSDALYSSFLSDLSMASTECTLVLTQFSKHFIRMFINESDKLQDLVDTLWKIVNYHIREGQTLWPIYRNCIKTILHKQMLCSENENVAVQIEESWESVFELGERKMAVTSIAAEEFFSSWNDIISANPLHISFLEKYLTVFLKIATFGPLRQKKEKPFNKLFTFLEKCEEFDDLPGMKSFQQHDQQVRIIFVNFILHLPNNNQSNEFAASLIQALVDYDQGIVKKCFYANSLIHRQKLRCWQAVLILLPKLPTEFDFSVLLPRLFTSCEADNQPSVKYLIEWVIVLILLTKPQLTDMLIKQFDVATEKKIFSVTYILSTLIQMTKSISDDNFNYIVDKIVLKILPWAQSQHLASRVHSHVLLELMSQRIETLSDKELIKKYHFLPHCFTLSEKNTAAVKHRKALSSKFYVSTFNAVKSYNLETIFNIFLKQHAVLGDEWIQPNCFSLPETLNGNHLLTIRRHDDVGQTDVKSKDEKSEADPKVKSTNETGDQQQQYIDTQKKIMPWNLIPSDDLMLQSELSRKKDLGCSELILCAVLVDKIPNLGGLARTSEIFGVKRLVIGSNRYLCDPSFKSLSVTSEKWLDIEQVIPIKLASYLDEMRNEGYTIVGVEQTAKSQMIGQFKFPHKSILVLGNEKTGIPVEIIQLLDECVEIPQLGIIRSLNVHISGAIMIWEYCKQHSLSK